MNFLATTTVSILRGTSENEYGDEIDTALPGDVIATGIPASIMEQRTPLSPRGRRTVMQQANETPRDVRWLNIRLPAGTDVQQGDRLRDENSGHIYHVDTVASDSSPVTSIDLRIEARQTS